jgi:hypothetical protein
MTTGFLFFKTIPSGLKMANLLFGQFLWVEWNFSVLLDSLIFAKIPELVQL